ncbi:hypothetical protein ACFXTU_004657 [Salmonella enterica]
MALLLDVDRVVQWRLFQPAFFILRAVAAAPLLPCPRMTKLHPVAVAAVSR